jgi:hypothetical protein
MAERYNERLNWFHQTWHGSPPTCDRKLMAPKKWRIHHFSRANMVSGYFSLLTQLFAWQPSVSVQVVSCSLVRANFLLCACTWKLSWFNQHRHDKPLAATQQKKLTTKFKVSFFFRKTNLIDLMMFTRGNVDVPLIIGPKFRSSLFVFVFRRNQIKIPKCAQIRRGWSLTFDRLTALSITNLCVCVCSLC